MDKRIDTIIMANRSFPSLPNSFTESKRVEDGVLKYISLRVLTAITAILSWRSAVAQRDIPNWKPEYTEKHWEIIAEIATRTQTSPRFKDSDVNDGERILNEFGRKHLPTAYMQYQEKRQKAKTLESMFAENFPNGRSSDVTGGDLYEKIKKKLTRMISEMDRRHDELCYYYLLHEIGIISDSELTNSDSANVCIMFPCGYRRTFEEMYGWRNPARELIISERIRRDVEYKEIKQYVDTAPLLSEAERDFTKKHLPKILSAYNYFTELHSRSKLEYAVIRDNAIKIDAVNGYFILEPLVNRLHEMRAYLDKLVLTIKKQKLLYTVEETTTAQLENVDNTMEHDIQRNKKTFSICEYYHQKRWRKLWIHHVMADAYRTIPLVALPYTMIRMPNKNYAICQYEVTKGLVHDVLHHNERCASPSDSSWEEPSTIDQSFIPSLNSMSSGYVYRIPTREEWLYACKAGTTKELDEFCKISSICNKSDAWITWNCYQEILPKQMPVGVRNPNAFGIFDMIGNVGELCSDGKVYGGTYQDFYWYGIIDSQADQKTVGLRLAVTLPADECQQEPMNSLTQ